MLRLLCLFFAMIGSANLALAQDQVRLLADAMQITDSQTLVAQGHVQAFYKNQILSAQTIVYDQTSDRLLIEGPIVLSDDSANKVLASQADLAADFSEGIMTSARFVLAEQLQLAAANLQRVDGRYSVLNKVVASSCKVCKASSTPLWEIRAKRVLHDEVGQQLYFDNAQLRVAGVPVFYLPRLRMPDPSLDRTTGFLIPTLRSSTLYGTGLRLPYFITIGKSRDLTLTPFFSTKGTKTLEFRYRQVFAHGNLNITGSGSRDSLLAGKNRGYMQASGNVQLPQGFSLQLRGEVVSDPAYLLDYGYAEIDRLDSRVEITRTKRNEYISARFISLNSIRESDYNATLPSLVTDMTFARRFSLTPTGGMGKFQIQTHSHIRTSTVTTDTYADGIADGRDLSRVSLHADWRRNFYLQNGLQMAVLGETAADFYKISQDAVYGGTKTRLHGAVGAELRWPWVKAQTGGASQLLEPVAQLVLASNSRSSIPNEDSILVEFDEGNLFALSRFPGSDAVEDGARANLGVNYLRSDPNGWTLGVTAGRVVRANDPKLFSAGSGLNGLRSNWMVATQLDVARIKMTNRMLFDDRFGITKAELAAGFQASKLGMTAKYVHTIADAAESRNTPIREITLASSYVFANNWTGSLGSRYDFESKRMANANGSLIFRNECLLVDLSLSRRFTSSTSVSPTTDFGLSVELLGFGGSSAVGPARQCRR
jgi:LPS-assembly protein